VSSLLHPVYEFVAFWEENVATTDREISPVGTPVSITKYTTIFETSLTHRTSTEIVVERTILNLSGQDHFFRNFDGLDVNPTLRGRANVVEPEVHIRSPFFLYSVGCPVSYSRRKGGVLYYSSS
jgi:hypothetical protein